MLSEKIVRQEDGYYHMITLICRTKKKKKKKSKQGKCKSLIDTENKWCCQSRKVKGIGKIGKGIKMYKLQFTK